MVAPDSPTNGVASAARQRPTLLVGSVNLADAEAVFSAAATHLGSRLASLPDGETGDRLAWIGWQASVLEDAPFLKRSGRRSADAYGGTVSQFVRYRVAGSLDSARFPSLGYAGMAARSFALFSRMRDEGRIPGHIRFQVSLPTPLAPLAAAIEPEDFLAVERLYEDAMRREVDAICETIPPAGLAIQWDVSIEVAIFEKVAMQDGLHLFDDPLGDLTSRIAKLIGWVPEAADVGFHLCYGDYEHKHFVEPSDMRLMVEMANSIFDAAERRIDWFHMPVPADRDDDIYFAPLSQLRKPEATQAYLGLAHLADGIEGGRRRIEAAARYLPDFGIATECGMGRRPPETIPAIMRVMAELAES